MSKLELLDMLTNIAKEYRSDSLESVNRNKHMNECEGMLKISPNNREVVDAILVDFINYIGVRQGVDYALYVKDLKS